MGAIQMGVLCSEEALYRKKIYAALRNKLSLVAHFVILRRKIDSGAFALIAVDTDDDMWFDFQDHCPVLQGVESP
jgi:hypothetical protein